MTRVTSDPLVEGEHGFEFVLELVAGAGFVGELEAERGLILADLADDPPIGEFLAGAGEGVAGREFAGDAGIEGGGPLCLLDRLRPQDHRFHVCLGRVGADLGVGLQLGNFGPLVGDTLHNLVLDEQRGKGNRGRAKLG